LAGLFEARSGATGHDGYPGLRHLGAGLGLAPHHLDRVGVGPDERYPFPLATARELGVLGQEAIAGHQRVTTRAMRDAEQPIGGEIALRSRRRTDRIGLVGEAEVGALPIGLAVDGDGAQAHLAQRAQDADRDLPPVGDQHLTKHVLSSTC
jgi:hypothetical protein